jgi:Protein of unknown function (DUF3489)
VPETAAGPAKAKGERKANKARSGKKGRAKKAASKPKDDRTNKKEEVIAMMKRPKGATLPEIMKAPGWQAHTVPGFVSILGSKVGEKIESSKNAAGRTDVQLSRSRLVRHPFELACYHSHSPPFQLLFINGPQLQ